MKASTPSIAVIMSTYNGATHLREQLDSIVEQSLAPARILVRDDGSKDNTLQILEEYQQKGQLELVTGKNLGVTKSFLELIRLATAGADYIALCDQDDVWHADKLERAVSKLAEQDASLPCLYCSEYIFCDADMNPSHKSQLNKNGVDFDKMLYENRVSGNTTVINKALADEIVAAGPEGVYTHDWWLALVATATGSLIYDDFASLEYRRTGNNASPTGKGGLQLLAYRFKTFFQKGEFENITVQLQKLEHDFGSSLSPQKQATLRLFLHGNRFQKAFAKVKLRQEPKEELALRLLFLLGKL